jgi:hypothetical protein
MGGLWSYLPLGIMTFAAVFFLGRMFWPDRVMVTAAPAMPAREVEFDIEAEAGSRAQTPADPGVRTLDAVQRKRISTSASPAPAAPLTICYVDCGDCYAFARELAKAFGNSIGWKVQPFEPLDPLTDPSPTGVLVPVANKNHLTDEEEFFTRALERGGIRHEIRALEGLPRAGQAIVVLTPPEP